MGVDYPRTHDVAPVFSEQIRKKREVPETEVLKRIEGASFWLAQARAPAFYFERDYNAEDAHRAFQDAEFVLTRIKEMLKLTERQPQ